MAERRTDIPDPIKRSVRQRCGFGCIFCGAPVYDYHHIEWHAVVQEHKAENITLLCPNHHREEKAGRLPVQLVRERNLKPRNEVAPYTPYHQLYYDKVQGFSMCLGGIWFESVFHGYFREFTTVMINERPLLKFHQDDGHLLIDLELYADDDTLILHIKESEVKHITDIWDIEFIGQNLIVRYKPYGVLLHLVFQPPARLEIKTAILQYNGRKLFCDTEKISDERNNTISSVGTGRYRYGIVVGKNVDQYSPALLHIG